MPFFGPNKLLALTFPASFGGDVLDAGCLVVFQGMACVVEKNDILYITVVFRLIVHAMLCVTYIVHLTSCSCYPK